MSINYAAIFSSAIDQALVATLTSGYMEADAADVQYQGGNTVKLATITTPGLGTYSRTGGYPGGAVSVDWTDYVFDMDRSVQLNIDQFDVDETNFVLTVANALKTVKEVDIDPEIDGYRYSTVYTKVLAKSALATPAPMEAYTPNVSDILTKIKADMTAVQDTVGETAPIVCYMSRKVYGILSSSSELSKQMQVLELNRNGINTKVYGIDDMPIIPVPSARMRTAYTYNDGSANFGFAAKTNAGRINWIIAPRGSLKGVVKGDEVKVIEPAVNQKYSGWSIMFRLYHTLIVLDAKIASMRVSFEPGIDALTVTVAASAATSGATTATATAGTGNKLAYGLTAASLGGTALKDVHISALDLVIDDYTSGADIAATAGKYLTVVAYNTTTGLVVKSFEKKLVTADIKA